LSWKLALGSTGSGLAPRIDRESNAGLDGVLGFDIDHVFLWVPDAEDDCGFSFSCLLFLRKGLLLKKLLLFFWTSCWFCAGAAATGAETTLEDFNGDLWPLAGSTLDIEVALETSLRESRLEGLLMLDAEPLSEAGPPVRQNIVIPSVGYALWGTLGISPW
jgi:hypothetical protein